MNNASSLAKIFAVVGLTVMVWILAHQSTRTEVLGTITLRLTLGDGQELDPSQMTGTQWRVANNERNEQVIEINTAAIKVSTTLDSMVEHVQKAEVTGQNE